MKGLSDQMREINFLEKKEGKKFPAVKKMGVISPNGGEVTPFIYKGRLMLLENFWEGYREMEGTCAAICDYFTRKFYAPIGGDGAKFYSAYCENDRIYVFGTLENRVYRYVSDDLINWTGSVVLEFPDNFELFNTSVCKGDGTYMMAVECGWAGLSKGIDNKVGNEYVGVPFTEFFAESPDLENWSYLPLEKSYTKDRYCACPVLRYSEGYYYMICLEALPLLRYAPYMYRTQDFETWEIGLYNPILIASEEDRHPKEGVYLTPEEDAINATHIDTNNSDIDLCEYEGKTYILYCAGNQNTYGGMTCEAIFDGSLDEYLKSNFE